MEIIDENKENMELVDISVTEDELKALQDGFEMEKPLRDSNYAFEDYCGEIIMLFAYDKKIECKEKEFDEKLQELREIRKEISKTFDEQRELMQRINNERIC